MADANGETYAAIVRIAPVGPLLLIALSSTEVLGAPNATNTLAQDSYQLTTVPVPDGVPFEVGGLGFASDGSLFICTRRGEIWVRRTLRRKNENGNGAAEGKRVWSRFAEGLHEPLGLAVVSPYEVIVAQRPELTRVTDTNKDGSADRFTTVTAAFGVSGNFHEYHYGPVVDKAGNLYGTLNVGWLQHADSSVPYRGWAYKVSRDGTFTPLATGLRSPAGVGISPEGELFATDNQGDWWPTSPLLHIKPGKFYGNPAGLRWETGYSGPKDSYEVPQDVLERRRTLPALWFVYGALGHSPTEPVWDTTKGKFGPFAGQMFVGDQTNSQITRIALEKVNGEYQGAAIPFRAGLGSGITRMAFGADNALYVGGTDRGWGAVGGKPFALERLNFTGEVPFEIHSISAAPDGFLVRFTQPPKATDWKNAVTVTNHSYRYWRNYGSPNVDVTSLEPTEVVMEPDGLRIRLAAMAATRVYTFKLRGIVNQAGAPLVHNEAYYTLTQVPAVAAPVRPLEKTQ